MKYTHNKYLEVDHCNSINVSYILCVNRTELQSIYQDVRLHHAATSPLLCPPPDWCRVNLSSACHRACCRCWQMVVTSRARGNSDIPLTCWLIDTKYIHSASTYFSYLLYLLAHIMPIWQRPASVLCWWQIYSYQSCYTSCTHFHSKVLDFRILRK